MTNLYRDRTIQDIDNAIIMFSLEWVNRGYSGYAIEVRRESDSATSNFGYVNGKVDYASIDTWRSGSPVHIRTLYDQGPYGFNAFNNNNNATQPILDTVNEKMIFSVANKTRFNISHNNILNLDGVDWTIIVNAKHDGYNNSIADGTNAIFIKGRSTAANPNYGFGITTASRIFLKNAPSERIESTNSSIGYRKTWIGTKSGTTVYIYEDNTELINQGGLSGLSDGTEDLIIGADNTTLRYADMDFYSAYIYKGVALSSSDRRLYNSEPELYIGVAPRRIYGSSQIDLFTLREDGGGTTQKFQLEANSSYPNVSTINTFLNGNNGYFTEWYDQVNNSRKFVQGTTAWQPPYLENAINNRIGFSTEQPILTLNRLAASENINISSAATFFCVVDLTAANQGTGGASIFGNNSTFAADTFIVTFFNTYIYLRIRDSSNNVVNSDMVSFATGRKIYSVTCDGGNTIRLYDKYNNELVSKVVPGGFLNTMVKPFFGTFEGKGCEFRIYRSVLSQDIREDIERDMAAYYGISGY